MSTGSPHALGRVSRATLAVNPAVWMLYASMFALFAVSVVVLSFVVPGLRPDTCLPFAAGLAAVAITAFRNAPPALGTSGNHVAIATVYVFTAIGMVAFDPHSLVPLSPAMFLGPFAAVRLRSHWQIAAHCLAGSIALGTPAALGLIGSSATFAVLVLVPAIWLLAFCVVIVLDAAEAQGVELEQLARRDPLTGVGNRRLLHETLADEIASHRRDGRQLSVIALDLNGFKALNDAVGHSAGDAVLQHVAAALTAASRPHDTVVRQGGDEFCVVLSNTTREQARFVRAEIHTRLAALADGDLPITTGVGIATFPADCATSDELLHVADTRLGIDKANSHPRLDPRSEGLSTATSGAPRLYVMPAPAPPAAAGFLARVSRRELARNPYLWFATGMVFATFAVLAAGCVLLIPGSPSWALGIPLGAAAGALLIFVTQDGPAMDSITNHVLLACIYIGSAAFMAACPSAAGAGLSAAIFIGPQVAVRLIDRRQIIGHYVAATLVFSGLVALGFVDLTTSLALLVLLPSVWGLGLACMGVLEAAERQGEELERLVRRDPLTGVGNRRMLTEQLAYELALHSHTRRSLTVLALDLNGFKALNDQFGHAAGDQLLCEVAAAIRSVTREHDTVVRQGGDEFCILLPDTTGEGSLPTANAIRVALSRIDAHGLTISTGVGTASYPTEATTPEGLLEAADELLRSSKAMAKARDRRAAQGPEHRKAS